MSDPNIQAPTLDAPASAGTASMSTPETLAGIFFEPERTFEALRERPRFLAAALILVALVVGMTALVMNKVDFNAFITDQIQNGPRSAQMDDAQKQKQIEFMTGPGGKFWSSASLRGWLFMSGSSRRRLLGEQIHESVLEGLEQQTRGKQIDLLAFHKLN